MNSGHTCLFHKGFDTVYFGDREKNTVNLPHSEQRKHAILGKIKQISKSRKIAPRKKVALELLHHRLGHRYTISFIAGDTAKVWMNIELIIDSDPFCT